MKMYQIEVQPKIKSSETQSSPMRATTQQDFFLFTTEVYHAGQKSCWVAAVDGPD